MSLLSLPITESEKAIWFNFVSGGRVEEVKELLEKIPTLLNEVNHVGRTALCLAAYDSRKEVVDYLLSKNALLNIKDSRGDTVIHEAAYCGNCLGQILEVCSDLSILDAPDKFGTTPVMRCTELSKIKMLFEKGVNLNKRNGVGGSLLSWRISDTHVDVLEFLNKQEMTWDEGCEKALEHLSREKVYNAYREKRVSEIIRLATEIKIKDFRLNLEQKIPTTPLIKKSNKI